MPPGSDFTQAVEAHYERVYRLARVMTGDDHAAQDLTQETFLEALKGWGQFRGEAACLTWLIAILRRRYLLFLRGRREPAPRPPPEPRETPLDIEPALAQLSEPIRTTLMLFYFESLDYASIATALDCPIGTVRSRLHQGREELRRLLTPLVKEHTP